MEKHLQAHNNLHESDAKKLADEHLADPNHVITDEAFSSIKVGSTPATPDAVTTEGIQQHERTADHKANDESEATPGAQKATPWDVINP